MKEIKGVVSSEGFVSFKVQIEDEKAIKAACQYEWMGFSPSEAVARANARLNDLGYTVVVGA
jgi:hypothetical protein